MEEAVNDLRGKAGESVDIETKRRIDAWMRICRQTSCRDEQLRMEVYKRIASIRKPRRLATM